MKSAIGIMGGTFNPFHNGHLQLALQAYRQFELSKVLVMPSGTPAHKSTKELIAASHRCQMVFGAIADYPYLELSLLEVERKGNTYTSDTLKALHRQNPDLKIYFIIGADSLFDLPKWHEPEYVMQHCILLAANRDVHAKAELAEQKRMLEKNYGAEIAFLKTPDMPYSSTDIRKKLQAGESVDGMLPKTVEKYIREHHLYQ